jgi:hypothetical protein
MKRDTLCRPPAGLRARVCLALALFAWLGGVSAAHAAVVPNPMLRQYVPTVTRRTCGVDVKFSPQSVWSPFQRRSGLNLPFW